MDHAPWDRLLKKYVVSNHPQRLAYTPENTEELLEKGARDYVSHPRGVRFAGDRLYLSSIYDWRVNEL